VGTDAGDPSSAIPGAGYTKERGDLTGDRGGVAVARLGRIAGEQFPGVVISMSVQRRAEGPNRAALERGACGETSGSAGQERSGTDGHRVHIGLPDRGEDR
jgi:hypothetical protein